MVGNFQLEGGPTGEVDVLPQPEDAHRHGHRPLPPEVDVGCCDGDGAGLEGIKILLRFSMGAGRFAYIYPR